MITWQLIKGASVGLEYFDNETLGFGVNADIGLLRVTWYKDIELVDEDEEEL